MTKRITDDTIRDWRETDNVFWWGRINRLRVVCNALLELRDAAQQAAVAVGLCSLYGPADQAREALRKLNALTEGGGND